MFALTVQPRSRLFHGHEWVYASDVKNVLGNPAPGDVISLRDTKGRTLGSAIYNPNSQIVARRFSYRKQDLDAEFFLRRIERAIEHRASLPIDQKLCRLVWSESDGLPGLIVDRYGDHIVYQTLTMAMAQREDLIIAALVELLKPTSIVARNDAPVRRAEGLELEKKAVYGEAPELFEIETAGLQFQVDMLEGQKTGLYLDQIDNYAAVAKLAKGRRVLDCFTNQGGFAQACALAGATEVIAVDVSEPAINLVLQNARKAGVSIGARAENCFDFLKAAEKAGDSYDLIILDPPSFTKTKMSLNDAMRGYKEIHLRSMKMLQPGGILATFSCSHHVSAGDFRRMINEAAVDSKRHMRQLAVYSQRTDHPIVSGIPETEYLRGYALEVMGGW
ncbi:class I SAM-dependent rRNA methyltransferase [Phragmitibacter flavus]|uniref:Class I SAM-dependent rRNA methyltransferase n=1 Tax=Phragmitibacter flavus TaxID=2576071 RepID=A0A5R8KCI4_9BACT|nr:class I SAM-dependent rRNA methyltransferase [Phragmitibacter flavus]TLD70020.1 class I SAM-dependent rRNA methyltransferase [Phragmitibacter flavus]